MKCDHCHVAGKFVQCTARKIWEFDDATEKVTIFHYGVHSCIPTPKRNKDAYRKIEEAFRKNPKLKPKQMSVGSVVEAISEGRNWEEIDDISNNLLNEQHTRNLKKKAVSEANPHGHCFEALGILKAKTDQRDKFLIYKIDDRRLNGSASFVFKTSAFKARLCISMDRNSDTVLSKEYCHFDGKVNRCPGFTTLTASVYHPTLRRMITLATMETEGESEECVTIFWKEMDRVIKQESGNPDASFNPYGVMTDEAGGIWSSLKKHFPDDVFKNSVSCEFHYLQSVNRNTTHVEGDKHKRRYKKLAKQLMVSATPSAYFETFSVMENYIDKQNKGKTNLMNWLRWWDARRPHWAKAFKCDLSCPQTNLSEAVNASFTHRGSCQKTLLRAAYEDTAESILVENQYKQYKIGEKTGGSGPSVASKAARETAKQKREAVRMVEEMELLDSGNCFGTEAIEKAFQDCEIDPTCSFEPPKRGKSKVGRPPKKHVSVYDTDCDSSSSEESDNYKVNEKRASRTRKKPNKKFEKSLEKAVQHHKKNQGTEFNV